MDVLQLVKNLFIFTSIYFRHCLVISCICDAFKSVFFRCGFTSLIEIRRPL